MLLEAVKSPRDLKKVPVEKLALLAAELRQAIIESVSRCGGHLASSLGSVELILALHYCLNAPEDKIIFDVGHQAYAHKILTGRGEDFCRLRTCDGLSGFPNKDESEYDPFTTGHSSTAVSLALGLACASESVPDQSRKRASVAVIGDGSLSGGLCFEGLNNAGHMKKDIIVVLNTNELSIAPNVGAISTYLNKIISMPVYNRFKDSLERFAMARLPKGTRLVKLAAKFEEGLKGLFVPGMLFEELGFRYFGPFDGHDVALLVKTVRNLLTLKGPLLLHVVTKKGKGYPPAEADPVRFHGTGPFDVASGRAPVRDPQQRSYTDVFGKKLLDLAAADERVVAITAAMPEGTGLGAFRDAFPHRFHDVGIAEPHAVCFAAGLAKGGMRPVVAIYSTFLQRAYDQVIEDVALQNLPVIFALDRAGVVGEDGATHQGLYDIAYLRSIPRIAIAAPKDGVELEELLECALKTGVPAALRYPRGDVPREPMPLSAVRWGKAEVLSSGKDVLIVALGSMVIPALQAARLLGPEGISCGVINARFVRPLDTECIRAAAARARLVVTVEEGICDGGFGSCVSEALDTRVVRIGLPCDFISQGKRDDILACYGLTAEGIARRVRAAHTAAGT